jgi:hypothetical protein
MLRGLVNTANPVAAMYRCLWTPASYASRTVTFQVAPGVNSVVGSVYVQLGPEAGFPIYVILSHTHLDRIRIPIAPTPSSLAVLALVPLVRRRREAPP